MFLSSIDRKPFFTKPDGTVIRDLTASMFDLRNQNYLSYNMFRVPKDYIMRPDLISKAIYNNSLYAEIILKFNGISNPFTIDEGDIILIPDMESAQKSIAKPEGSPAEGAQAIRNAYKYIDPTKKPNKNQELKNFENRPIVSGAKEGVLPPNISSEGSTPLQTRNGRVYFGQGAETCLHSGMSSSEFLTTVIKSKKNKAIVNGE